MHTHVTGMEEIMRDQTVIRIPAPDTCSLVIVEYPAKDSGPQVRIQLVIIYSIPLPMITLVKVFKYTCITNYLQANNE